VFRVKRDRMFTLLTFQNTRWRRCSVDCTSPILPHPIYVAVYAEGDCLIGEKKFGCFLQNEPCLGCGLYLSE